MLGGLLPHLAKSKYMVEREGARVRGPQVHLATENRDVDTSPTEIVVEQTTDAATAEQ